MTIPTRTEWLRRITRKSFPLFSNVRGFINNVYNRYINFTYSFYSYISSKKFALFEEYCDKGTSLLRRICYKYMLAAFCAYEKRSVVIKLKYLHTKQYHGFSKYSLGGIPQALRGFVTIVSTQVRSLLWDSNGIFTIIRRIIVASVKAERVFVCVNNDCNGYAYIGQRVV